MSLSYEELFGAVSGDEFEEIPVTPEEFVTGEDFLNLPTPLSEYQYRLVKASSQIYKRETLHNLYGFEEGEKRWKQTYNEVIMELGKGSGKDFTSTVACAYIVYLLLCLKDPAEYYGKPPGDTIDILNIAINAAQANNVFFKGFKNRIERSPWFFGKYETKAGQIAFDKNINVYSGHSEREAWEGYNCLYVVLDEISGFALESSSGNEQAKTAQSIYDMYRASVTSRFPDYGKIVLLSFPRFKGDFIQQRYDAVVGEKETIIKSHTFKLDPELPDGAEGNEFTVEWEEDHIVSYNTPRVYALKRPSWEVNPTRKIEDYTRDFYDNPTDSLARFACMPPDAVSGFFKDRQKVELAFSGQNGNSEDGVFYEGFLPQDDKRYFIHIDLAQVQDRAAVAMAHVEKWEQRNIGGSLTEPAPVVVVDSIRYWTPTKEKSVDFTEIREYVLALKRRGFDIRLVTLDRWNSKETMDYFNSVGMKSEVLSVAKKHYTDMLMVVSEERLSGPYDELLITELMQLRITKNDKIDHTRKGSKDISDAVCGAIYNAIAHTPRSSSEVIEIKTLEQVRTENRQIEETKKQHDSVIRAPKRKIPEEIDDFLHKIQVI